MCQKCFNFDLNLKAEKLTTEFMFRSFHKKNINRFFVHPSGAFFKGAHIKSQFGRTVRILRSQSGSVGVSRGQCGFPVFLPHLLLAVALRNFIAP